jgi:hypothetical protein
MDIGAQFLRIADAKTAASELREAAISCNIASLRDESLSIVQEGLRVIEKIEQQVLAFPSAAFCYRECRRSDQQL